MAATTAPAFLKGAHPSLPNVFSPVKLGDITLSHRIVMGPMTRSRAPNNLANDLQAYYYAQRATPGGLLITEATPVSVTGHGYPNVPSLITKEHAAGWRKSTDAVHDVGGFIFAQLWHVGRVSIPDFQPNGDDPVSASATELVSHRAAKGAKARALTVAEIKNIVNDFKSAAALAVSTEPEGAGFDGVEIHGAHGYLIDQFLHSSSNLRTDEYGGSIENRARFLIEIVEAILEVVPSSKVAIRLSPGLGVHNVTDDHTVELFTYVLESLAKYKLAYIHLTEPGFGAGGKGSHSESELNKYLPLIQEPTKVLLTGGYRRDSAEEAVKSGRAHLVGIASPFIANPDLVLRYWHDHELTTSDATHYYFGSEQGYSDWPTYLETKGKKVFATSSL
ncbi:glycerol trinitrate reductase protein [Zopfochytrium polystomum]|nr:glycerol trinitrate reductase protein [Zopfochytrium polystomum]